MNPVAIPANATAYLNLEGQPGWEKDASVPGIGPCAPADYDIVQTVPPPIQPLTTMDLPTTGVKGSWCDWMAKKTVAAPAGKLNCVIRSSVIFDTLLGYNAFEVGRRKTDQNAVTDNGQQELVQIAGNLLRLDVVPGASGGWVDTGARFPMFQPGVLYEMEQYWVNAANGALSPQYFMLNGGLFPMPAKFQNIPGAVQSPRWALNEAVAAFQIDTNTAGVPYKPRVTMSVYFF